MLSELRGLVSVLESANPAARASVYADLGVSLRYDPRDRTVEATADLFRVVNVRVGGGTCTFHLRPVVIECGWQELGRPA
jgi:hypothetical protein